MTNTKVAVPRCLGLLLVSLILTACGGGGGGGGGGNATVATAPTPTQTGQTGDSTSSSEDDSASSPTMEAAPEEPAENSTAGDTASDNEDATTPPADNSSAEESPINSGSIGGSPIGGTNDEGPSSGNQPTEDTASTDPSESSEPVTSDPGPSEEVIAEESTGVPAEEPVGQEEALLTESEPETAEVQEDPSDATAEESTSETENTEDVAAQAPTLQFSVSDAAVLSGESVTLSWQSENADSCQATGGWQGARPVSGDEQSPAIDANTTFSLNCEGPGGSVVMILSVDALGGITLSWTAPTENTDGTPVESLQSFRIHYGETSGNYDESVLVDGSLERYELVVPLGEYFIALTAIDPEGDESTFSNEVRRNTNS